MTDPILERLCINNIGFVAVDAVQRAYSADAGTPMGAASD